METNKRDGEGETPVVRIYTVLVLALALRVVTPDKGWGG
jgi:hypothetical protein